MANLSLTLCTNSFFGSVLMSPIQMGSLSVNNSVTNISRLGTFKKFFPTICFFVCFLFMDWLIRVASQPKAKICRGEKEKEPLWYIGRQFSSSSNRFTYIGIVFSYLSKIACDFNVLYCIYISSYGKIESTYIQYIGYLVIILLSSVNTENTILVDFALATIVTLYQSYCLKGQ